MIPQYRQAVDQHRQRIFSFAHYSLRAKEDAEDVTQEVFIKLWQHWQKIDHSKLGGWLMRVAHNAVIDQVRKNKSANSQQDDYAEVEEQAEEIDEGRQLDQAAFKQQLMEAIKELDDPFRSIIVMRDVQGLSYAEIRETLDMSESQVKVYLHRSRRKLRENKTLRNLFNVSVGKPVTDKESLTLSTVKATNE
ncbi:MAG: sigma-70 family RNA polymerase sigma factor [Gammaproteobacteria bacterium]|nr:sigma-70 family RNA polymerase sigma factor [Gammaproteobacteria bacterium]MDD9958379.1 sigma-70 family RNA polymerase sigma factor [Gammaproteobacteria bacterium]